MASKLLSDTTPTKSATDTIVVKATEAKHHHRLHHFYINGYQQDAWKTFVFQLFRLHHLKPAQIYFAKKLLHRSCGKIHHGQLVCLPCYNTAEEHRSFAQPSLRDGFALWYANPIDVTMNIRYLKNACRTKIVIFPLCHIK
jgi:hypothetical protein